MNYVGVCLDCLFHTQNDVSSHHSTASFGFNPPLISTVVNTTVADAILGGRFWLQQLMSVL